MISIIITTYNEGAKLASTIESVRANTSDYELIIVDDGSDDGSTDECRCDIMIKHPTRVGIAQSRLDGIAKAKGECFGFLDAHQAVTEGCFNLVADIAMEHQAIVCPCTRGPVDRPVKKGGVWTGHGANLRHQDSGIFVAEWKNEQPRDKISRCQSPVVPGYVIPRAILPKVRWNDGQEQWGGSEPNIAIKAWFADVDVLHLCGPIARHEFREKERHANGKLKRIIRPFSCPFSVTWRNHARTCRICFDDSTWHNYWIPKVFSKWTDDFSEFEESGIIQQHKEFQQWKRRDDEHFWRSLMLRSPYPDFSGKRRKRKRSHDD